MSGYILDLDNTLYDENQYLRSVFLFFWKRHIADQELFDQICSQTLSDQTRLHSQDIFKTFLQFTPMGYTPKLHDELFEIYTQIDCHITLYQDAKGFLDYLTRHNHLIAILTNGPILAQKNKIRNLGLSSIPTFFARENGIEYEKPHPNAFQKVLDFFALSPQECYMIGDNPHTDIYGAYQAGITPIWLQRGYAKELQCDIPARIIKSLSEHI